MKVEIKPEDELLVQRSLDTGMFSSAEEVVHHALKTFELEQEIAADKQAISGHIDEGWEQLDRGQRLTPEESMARQEVMKAAWRNKPRGT
jgi:Arc/MetJ-type ribon-helix-helix transcriptional regulator